jgi:hypothetical protein
MLLFRGRRCDGLLGWFWRRSIPLYLRTAWSSCCKPSRLASTGRDTQPVAKMYTRSLVINGTYAETLSPAVCYQG